MYTELVPLSVDSNLKVPVEKTLTTLSVMDCMEQGGGTVLLETYEPTCETAKADTTQPMTLGRGTTVVLESYESTAETVVKDESSETPSLSEPDHKSDVEEGKVTGGAV